MDKFNEREKAFEDKFAHDAEIEFKIKARANKLLGLWAAEKLNMKPQEADSYAMKLVEVGINVIREVDVTELVFNDFSKKKVDVTLCAIKAKLASVEDISRAQLMGSNNQ